MSLIPLRAEITIMSGQHAANEIKATEKKEGKSIKYYTLLTMQEAETLNDAVADDSFDVAAVSNSSLILKSILRS